MALRHEAEFKNDRHEIFYLAFYDSEYSGTDPISDLHVEGSGFSLEWDGRAENTHEPILSSACSIPIFSDDANAEAFVDAIMGGQEGQFRVEIHQGPEASRRLFWSGVLFCDLTIKDEMPSLIKLEATDDLGLLGEILYKQTESAEYTDTTHLPDVLCRILSKCRHLDAWGASENFLMISDSVQHDDMAGEPYTRKIIINHSKLRNVDDNGQPQFHTCRAVLTNMLNNLGARMFQADGFFWVIPLARMTASSFSVFSYLKDGSNGNMTDRPPGYSAAYGGEVNKIAIAQRIAASDIQKLSGWEFGQLPPLRSVKYPHQYNGSAFDWYGLGPSNGTDITDGWSFANGSPTLESGDIVSLTFAYHFSFTGWGTSGGSRGRRIKFSFKYRHGTTHYAVREGDPMTNAGGTIVTANYGTAGNVVEQFVPEYGPPGYSASSANRVECFTAAFDRYVGADLQGSFTITFPALSSDANAGTEVGFWNVEVLDEDGNVDASAPASFAVEGLSTIYQMRGAATFDGDVITYERLNTDEDSRENLELTTAILADKVGNSNPNQHVWLINDGGTYTQSTPNWSNHIHNTASTSISDLTCLDIISARYEALPTCTGDFEGNFDISPLRMIPNVGEGTGYFLPMRLTYSANASQYSGEFCLLSFSTDANSTGGNDGQEPWATAGMSISGPRSFRQSMQGAALAMALESQRVAQDSQSLFQVSADVETDYNAKFAALSMDDLSDVSIPSTPTTGHYLKWDGSTWRAAAVSGGGASALDDLTDVDVGSASDGQVLKYNATDSEWQASDEEDVAFSDLTDVNPSLSPGAGDMLIWTTANGGQWSSATIATGVGSQINMGNLGNVTEGTGASGNLLVDFNLSGAYWITQTPAQWAGTHLPLGLLSNVSNTTPTAGDLLQWSGTQWQPHTPFSFHVITSSFYAADGNGDYIPIGGTLSETTSSNYYTIWSAPADGEVVKATCLVQATTAGSTTLRVRKYPTPVWIDQDTQNLNAVYSTFTFNFDTATFSAGDRLQFFFDPTGRPNGVQLSILIKLTH